MIFTKRDVWEIIFWPRPAKPSTEEVACSDTVHSDTVYGYLVTVTLFSLSQFPNLIVKFNGLQ